MWKSDSLVMSHSVILQHSEPYSSVNITLVDLQPGLGAVLRGPPHVVELLKAFLALLRRFLMSLPAPSSCLIVLPR